MSSDEDSDYSADFTNSYTDEDEEEEEEQAELTLKEALVKFYRKHAPTESHKVDAILKKYAGREAVIFKALRRKYGAVPDFDLGRLLLQKHGAKEAETSEARESKDSASSSARRGGQRHVGGSARGSSELRRTGSELSELLGSEEASNVGNGRHGGGVGRREPPSRPESAKLKIIEYDDLEMGEMIGGGGFALVYRCKYEGKTLACKLIFDPNVSEENKQEFFDELNTMKTLWHPNIVTLTGYGNRPSKMFFLMDLCEGSVYDLLHTTRIKLKDRQLCKMALEIALGMEYLHSVSPPIIHRDLKTENVLLASDGSVKICDFGMSQNVNPCAGTPLYMAPELFKGQRFTNKVDVFAYGVIVWEIYAREKPWVGYDPLDVRTEVLKGNRPEVPRFGIPYEIKDLIKKSWDQQHLLRPSFQEIVEILTPFYADIPEFSAMEMAGADLLDDMMMGGK